MKPAKIILVNPPLGEELKGKTTVNVYPPMGILYIGTLLKRNGFAVKLIDAVAEPDYLAVLKQELDEGNVGYIGLSVMTSQITSALKTSEFIRRHSPGTTIVWGGIHPTLFPEQTCQDSRIDIVVINEGEATSLDLAQKIANKEDLALVPGIAYKNKQGSVIRNADRPLGELIEDSFDFSLVDVERYINRDMSQVGGKDLPGGSKRRSLPILAGLGCPYRCTFCINSILKKRYRFKSARSIVAEMEKLSRVYGVNDFGLIDEDFFIHKKRLIEFLDLLEQKQLNISWHTSLRADHFSDNYLDQELMSRVRKLGGFHFGVGAESGSKEILEKLKKQIDTAQVFQVARLSRLCGFNVGFSFMIGLPGETEKHQKETIKFCHKILQENEDNYIIGPQIFRPYPGSPLFEEALSAGLKLPATLEQWGQIYSDMEGYFSLDKMPWIREPEKMKCSLFYLYRTFEKGRPAATMKRILYPVLRALAQWRVRTGFFKVPVEYWLFRHILKREC